MSEDLTNKLPKSDSDNLILTAIQNLETYVRSSFDQLVGWVGSIDSRLKHLEQKVEERLHDTRPIWHKVVAEIGELQSGQKRIEEGLSKLNSTVREVDRDQIVINQSLHRIQLDLRNFDERLYKCEVSRRQNSST